MQLEDWLWLFVGVSGAGMSVFSLVVLIDHVRSTPLEKRSRFIIGYSGVFILLGIPGWIQVAESLTRLGAPKALSIAIVLTVNVLVQLFLLHAFVTTARQLIRELGGTACFGGKEIPRERYTSVEYARIHRRCLVRDLVGLVFVAALSLACLTPWLW